MGFTDFILSAVRFLFRGAKLASVVVLRRIGELRAFLSNCILFCALPLFFKRVNNSGKVSAFVEGKVVSEIDGAFGDACIYCGALNEIGMENGAAFRLCFWRASGDVRREALPDAAGKFFDFCHDTVGGDFFFNVKIDEFAKRPQKGERRRVVANPAACCNDGIFIGNQFSGFSARIFFRIHESSGTFFRI